MPRPITKPSTVDRAGTSPLRTQFRVICRRMGFSSLAMVCTSWSVTAAFHSRFRATGISDEYLAYLQCFCRSGTKTRLLKGTFCSTHDLQRTTCASLRQHVPIILRRRPEFLFSLLFGGGLAPGFPRYGILRRSATIGDNQSRQTKDDSRSFDHSCLHKTHDFVNLLVCFIV